MLFVLIPVCIVDLVLMPWAVMQYLLTELYNIIVIATDTNADAI